VLRPARKRDTSRKISRKIAGKSAYFGDREHLFRRSVNIRTAA
jgi:hypothetical protein